MNLHTDAHVEETLIPSFDHLSGAQLESERLISIIAERTQEICFKISIPKEIKIQPATRKVTN